MPLCRRSGRVTILLLRQKKVTREKTNLVSAEFFWDGDGDGVGIRFGLGFKCLAVAIIFIAARAGFTWAATLKRLKNDVPTVKPRLSRFGRASGFRQSRPGDLPPDFLQLDLQPGLVVGPGAQHHFLA